MQVNKKWFQSAHKQARKEYLNQNKDSAQPT